MASNTIEEASLALLTAQLDNLTTEIAQLQSDRRWTSPFICFCLPRDTEKLAAAGSPARANAVLTKCCCCPIMLSANHGFI
jgi:hypothetical protein